MLVSFSLTIPQMVGYRYICRIIFRGKEALEIDVETKYTASSMNVSCQFKAEQVGCGIVYPSAKLRKYILSSCFYQQTRQLLQMSSGVGGAQLSLIYVNSNGTEKQEIEFIRNSDQGRQLINIYTLETWVILTSFFSPYRYIPNGCCQKLNNEF